MSTDVITFTSGETTIRYREQYVSEGLNKKLAVAVPWGTYRGFKLGVDSGAGDRTVNVEADATASDHVAVYQDATGRSLTIRRTGGDFLLDLSSYASVTVYVTLYCSYSVGATTLATIRVYTEAEYAVAPEKDEVVILGKVIVPAATLPVVAASISGSERRMAWQHKTSEAVAWSPLFRNPGFEWSDITSTSDFSAAYWQAATSGAGNSSIGPSDTDPYSGDKHLVLNYVSGTIDFSAGQYLTGTPVQAGQRIRVRLFKKMVQAATAGTLDIVMSFATITGGSVVPIYDSVDTTIDATYEEIDRVYEVPSSLGIVALSTVAIVGQSMTFGGAGDAIRIDDFQVWLEGSAEEPYPLHSKQGDTQFNSIRLWRLGATFNQSGDQPLVQATGTPPAVELLRSDRLSGAGITPPNMEIGGSLEQLGRYLVDDSAQALTPRLNILAATGGVEAYTLISRASTSATSGLAKRVYREAATGAHVVTHNAEWTASGWTRDALAASTKMTVDGSGFKVESHNGGSPIPWLDSAWDEQWYVDPDGKYMYLDDLRQQWKNTTTTSNPLYTTTPFANALYAKNVVKSWGYLLTDGASGFTAIQGFNIAPTYSGNNIRVNFNQAMSVAAYAAVATHFPSSANDRFCNIVNQTTSSFDIELWDVSSAASVNMSIVPNIGICFIQMGEQSS